eukprot:5885320-Prorocentrum_lima.AAC.1
MTSSLVGSEMCIRDSPFPSYTTRPAVMLFPTSTTGPQTTATALCAVSYTHLTLPTICSV